MEVSYHDDQEWLLVGLVPEDKQNKASPLLPLRLSLKFLEFQNRRAVKSQGVGEQRALPKCRSPISPGLLLVTQVVSLGRI